MTGVLLTAAAAGGVACQGDNSTFQNSGPDTGPAVDAGPADDSGADAAPDVHVPVDPQLRQASDALTEARCDLLFRCCSADARESAFGVGGDRAQCINQAGLLPLSARLSMLTDSMRAGRIDFDPAVVEVCADNYRELDCTQWTTYEPGQTKLPGCIEMITPKVELGGECDYDLECKDGFCLISAEDGEAGTCTEYAGEGEDCLGEVPCGPNLRCDEFEERCVPRRENGQSCLNDADCQSGACSADPSGGRRCTEPPALCAEDEQDT